MADDLQTQVSAPSVDDVLADLKGFGVEDFEDFITITSKGKSVQIKLSNVPSEQEKLALLAVEDFKGYIWLQEVKCEILSRSISWLNNIDIRGLTPEQRIVVDPITAEKKDIQVVLRGLIKSWGQEYMQALWKLLMVHSQNIEDRLLKSFPEMAVMTEAERRLTERAYREIEEATKDVVLDTVTELYADEEETD